MTPTPPSGSQPLIYRIADALGVFHLVAPVNHTHSQSEVDGLTAALAAKMDAMTIDSVPTPNSNNLVTSGGVESKLIPVIDANELDTLFAGDKPHDVYIIVDPDLGTCLLLLQKRAARPPHFYYYQEIVGCDGFKIRSSRDKGEYDEWNTFQYLTDADVDSTPTLYSDKPVSSGGVKVALDGKAPLADTQVQVHTLEINQESGTVGSIYVDNLFLNGNTQVTLLVENATGNTLDVDDAFFTSQQNDLVFMSDNAITPNIPADSIVACRILKRDTPSQSVGGHYYLIIDGLLEF